MLSKTIHGIVRAHVTKIPQRKRDSNADFIVPEIPQLSPFSHTLQLWFAYCTDAVKYCVLLYYSTTNRTLELSGNFRLEVRNGTALLHLQFGTVDLAYSSIRVDQNMFWNRN